MGRREKILGLAALAAGLAAFHGLGWCVLLYPALLTWALLGLPPKRRLALAALWGVIFAAAFYHWAGAYGLLPWLALSLARGLPWVLYPVPTLLLARSARPNGPLVASDAEGPSPGRARLAPLDLVGGSLGLGLVSVTLLAGLTGVDWETPAGALTAWPTLLSPLRWVGLGTLALALGLLSHLLLSLHAKAALLGALLLGGWLAVAPTLARPATLNLPLRIALVQSGIAQDQKWDETHRKLGADQLLAQTRAAAQEGDVQLVIWPETAWPYRGMRRRVTNTRRIGKAARQLKVDILASSIEEVPAEGSQENWLNSVSLVLASGKFSAHYEKRRLAPFAEYLPLPAAWQEPLRGLAPFSRISRYIPGESPTIFTTSGGSRFATLICYESMAPRMAAEVAAGVDFLVVVTNDAPFNHSPANEAHFRSAILRAVETGKPVFQAANTGVTGAISPNGTVLTRTEPGLSGPSVQYIRP
jgi:apolipoprotein N-acyltransferase